jgi:nucleoid-associated protein YgaU
MAEEMKKGLFERIGDLFSNKDELAKTAEAKKKAAELAEQQQKAVKAATDKQAAEMAKARGEAAGLAEKQRLAIQAVVSSKAEEVKAAVIATHTVGANETLSHIALRYYGHATPPYYKVIYEFNKAVIGENMNIIRPGQVLEIPQLPQDLVK